jgi:hypothetical protein
MIFQLFSVLWVMPGRMKGVIVQFCKFGKWFLCVLCGVYGEKGMYGALRTVNLDSSS